MRRVQIKIEEKKREGGEGVFEGERGKKPFERGSERNECEKQAEALSILKSGSQCAGAC